MTRVCLYFLMVALIAALGATVSASDLSTLTRRVSNLERTIGSMRSMTNMMLTRITTLERLSKTQAATISTLADEFETQMEATSRSNAELRQQNAGLQTMLTAFERFFGSLMVESPDAFDPDRNVMERMDRLNAFLGNSESMLVGLRPDPETKPTNDSVDPEELGRVLEELEGVNTELRQKVSKLERRLNNSATAAGDRSLTGGTDDVFTLDQCSNKLKGLEAQVNALVSAALDQDSSDRRGSGSTSAISEKDREILEGSIYGTARGVTSVRKSVFSVAGTRPVLGRSAAQTVMFDHVFVNKGNHWNSTANVFRAAITGYYYFYFSLRSYDGYTMGVTLMKNDDYVTAMYTEADNRNVMESQGIILPLEIGDRVWLRLGPSTSFAVHSDTYKYCTFSGFLVYKGI